jgi:hypothetical protein
MSGSKSRAARRSQRSESKGVGIPRTINLYGSPDIVHFFIPLPEPIKVLDLTELPVSYVWNPIADDGPCFLLPSKGNVHYASRQTMIFHQDEVSMDMGPFEAAMKIATMALKLSGSRFGKMPAEENPGLPLAHTTVEVICILEPSQADPMEYALERALEVVRDFQTYYHLFTKTPVRRLTRKLLPPVIPVIRRSYPALDTWEPELLHVNNGGTALRAAATPTLSPEQLQNLLKHNRASRADVFNAFLLMRQEAMLSFATGSNAAASLFVAIAAETLLTELFLLLSWEEVADLQKTADILGERDNISKRLLNELASRLKGDWDRNGNGPLGEWQRQIANLRNDVAHAGKVPSEPEVDAAMNALTALEAYVGDRLAEVFRSYPQVAEIYLGNDGFARRNKLKSWQKFSPQVQFPAHASELFTRWKAEVKRFRSGPHEGNLEVSKAVVVMFGNGAERWYLVDDEKELSCPIPAPRLSPFSRENLVKLYSDGGFDVLSMEFDDLKPSFPKDPEWVPSYAVLPLASIHRWEQCRWVPPTRHP